MEEWQEVVEMESRRRSVRIAGIPVTVHWSVLLILALFTDGLAVSLLPAAADGYSSVAYWFAACVCAVVFMLCLLTHEFSHALVARHLGLRVQSITLWLFGGIARLDGQARTPRGDFAVAAVGPAASAVWSLLFWAASLTARAQGAGRLPVAALVWLAWANGVVAVFNLLPGAPLDGGRVLRALLWWRGGDRDRAAATAQRAGSVLGLVLVALGVLALFAGDLAGLWLAVLGLFIVAAARAELEADRLVRVDVTAAEIMTPDPVCAPGWYTLAAFLDWIGDHAAQSAYPVVDFDGRPTGVIVLADLARLPEQQGSVRVLELARPMSRITVIAPDAPAVSLLMGTRSRRGPGAGVPALVIESGRLVGTIDLDRLGAALQIAALRRRFART